MFSGCANTDSDGDYGAWSDGMTVKGRNILITNNTIINPSDVGIAYFGGANTVISNNIGKDHSRELWRVWGDNPPSLGYCGYIGYSDHRQYHHQRGR